jgi:menaquinone-dependent protoporphyrinogen IX oxidase
MKAITLYDTRFGNIERIAKSLETGLKQADGIHSAVCINAKEDVPIDSFKEYDLLCVGAPTEGFTASKSIKEFLESSRALT